MGKMKNEQSKRYGDFLVTEYTTERAIQRLCQMEMRVHALRFRNDT
jgi:hypothetical protein